MGDACPLGTEIDRWWFLVVDKRLVGRPELDFADLPRVGAILFFQVRNAPCDYRRDLTIDQVGTKQVVHLDGSQTVTISVPVDLLDRPNLFTSA